MLAPRKVSQTSAPKEEEIKSTPKLPKKRLVLGIGYNGLNFHGSQKQSDLTLLSSSQNQYVRTVESEIEKALYSAGMIAACNYGDLAKIKFGRATRTDKRVHALVNYFSAKLLVDPDKSMDELVTLIQSKCPSDIHVVSVNTSGRAFNVKNSVAYRLYDYYLPTFLLKPLSEEEQQAVIAELEKEKAKREKEQKQEEAKEEETKEEETKEEETKEELKEKEPEEERSIDGDLRRQFGIKFQDFLESERYSNLKKFEIPKEHFEKVSGLFTFYEGTKKYHNFTRKMTYKDSSASRYILKMTVSDPFKIKDIEYVRVTLKGQSFLYNQIRKMMGAVIQICRWGLKAEHLERYFKGNAMFVPTAPGQGLMLNRISFDTYNRVKVKNEDGRIAVSEEMETRITKFREQLIESIGSVEEEKQKFMKWLIWLDLHMAEQRIF